MVPPGPTPPDDRDRVDVLALAYRAGRGDLGELYRAVEPTFRAALAWTIKHHTLPTLSGDDMRQESWLIVDCLARRWEPSGPFGAFVRVSFPYELYRVVRFHLPTRRSKHVQVSTLPAEAWDSMIAHQVGADGRGWDGQLTVVEMLEPLEPVTRRVVALHVLAGLSLEVVAERLGLIRPAAYGRYRRGITTLAGRHGAFALTDDLRRLVAVLYAIMDRQGRIPGRAAVCATTGLSEIRYGDLMRLLAGRGAIVGRGERSTGRLYPPDRRGDAGGAGNGIMTTTASDDGWKVPEQPADTGHAARVRYLRHAIAQRVLAIPADVSKRSRAIRIAKARDRVRDRADWMSTTHIWSGGVRVSITKEAGSNQWFTAFCHGWQEVRAVLDDGEDISRFLFPSEAPS